MSRSLGLGACIAAALAMTGLGTLAVSAPAVAAGRPAPHQVTLHAAFERALPTAAAGQIAGVVPSRATRLSQQSVSPRTTAGCTEPNCDLSHGGGAVQHSPHVYLLLWGPGWSTAPGASAYLSNMYKGLGVTPGDTWSPITSQYAAGTGHPTFGKTVFEGAYEDTTAPPASVTPDDLAAEADAFVSEQGITDVADAQVVIAAQSGTCFSDGFAGSCGVASGASGNYCGWHSMTTTGVPFTNLPYQLDAGFYCGENWINSGSQGTYDGFSTVGGHEYAETITDPDPPTGWIDSADTVSGGEVADKCAWGGSLWGSLGSDPYGDVRLSTGSFAMQSLWSNAAGRCVLAIPRLTVPGTQKSVLGRHVSLQVRVVNAGRGLTYKAVGLPPGLSISRTTGKIAGTPAVTAGTFRARVTMSDYASSTTVAFAWQVSSKAGEVKGYHSLCADDYDGRASNGNKIDIWACDGRARQQITFAANGELKVAGKCIAVGRGTAVLEPCAGSAAETWARRANGEYLAGGRCLTDPRKSVRNGTQLVLSACNDGVSQRWSLP